MLEIPNPTRHDQSRNKTQAIVQPVGSPNDQLSVACSISL